MANKAKRQDVQDELNDLKRYCPELENIVLLDADARLGKLVALAIVGDYGSVCNKTCYMTYSEMKAFLLGYFVKSQNRLGE